MRRAGLAAATVFFAASVLRAEQAVTPPAPTIALRQVTDETGRRVTLPMVVRRIVSLAPNLTEIVYALGAEDRLAGVSEYSDYPAAARLKPSVGEPLSPSLEEVVALRPDLVLATEALNRRETVEALERLGLAVYATDPRSVEGMLESIEHIASLVGENANGKELVASLRARLEEVKQRLAGRPPKRVLFVVWEEPLITVGPHTFLGDALRWAGGESVAQTEQDWPKFSLEEVVRLQPDELVFASAHSQSAEATAEELRARPGWRDLTAVQQGHIAFLDDAALRPSPRLVDAIEQLERQLHPEAFGRERENGKGKIEGEGGDGRAGDPARTSKEARKDGLHLKPRESARCGR